MSSIEKARKKLGYAPKVDEEKQMKEILKSYGLWERYCSSLKAEGKSVKH